MLSGITDEVITESKNLMNAIDFLESPSGLNLRLYPVQRVVTKALYGVPFDYKPKKVVVWDKFRENILYKFDDECQYLEYAYNEGRCNIGDWHDIPPGGFSEGNLLVGRRGGKSQLVSALACYKLYQLLNVFCPQEEYEIVPGSYIDFTFLAQDDDGAGRLFVKMREDVTRAPFFQVYTKVNTTTELGFVSESDRAKSVITPTIIVRYLPCTTNSARGANTIFLAFDEFAHFRSAKGSNSDEVYGAATPATAQFVNRRGQRDAFILSITSPWKKVGKYFELHKQAMEAGPGSGIFTLRCSSAEMNPRIDSAFLRQQYATNSLTWKAEYGGDFLESSESYVSTVQLEICTDKGRHNVSRFATELIGRQYFWGLDLGMKNDATALAIAHFEYKEQLGVELVYDYIERMMVGERFDGLGIENTIQEQKYVDYKELPLQDMIAWLVAVNQFLPCHKGGTDQHGGSMLVQLLQMYGINGLELTHITTSLNSRMFYVLKGFIDQNRVRFPDVEKFKNEIKQVEAEIIGKYQIRVQAPLEKGSHDDMVDAVGLCAYVAQEWLQNEGRIGVDPTGSSIAMQQALQNSPGYIPDLDAVSLSQLRLLERQRKLQQGNMGQVEKAPMNPFSRQYRFAMLQRKRGR